MDKNFVLFAGSSNATLAQEIADYLKVPLGKIELKKFADGENYANYLESVRGRSVYIIQSTCNPANDNIMELLIMMDAARRAAAEKITCVIPYYGYGKQDRKANDREPITAKLVANMLQTAGVDRVIMFDLHVPQVQGFFDIPSDNLDLRPLYAEYIANKNFKDLVIVASDVGGAKRARQIGSRRGCRRRLSKGFFVFERSI